jgi:hypothetical protein
MDKSRREDEAKAAKAEGHGNEHHEHRHQPRMTRVPSHGQMKGYDYDASLHENERDDGQPQEMTGTIIEHVLADDGRALITMNRGSQRGVHVGMPGVVERGERFTVHTVSDDECKAYVPMSQDDIKTRPHVTFNPHGGAGAGHGGHQGS